MNQPKSAQETYLQYFLKILKYSFENIVNMCVFLIIQLIIFYDIFYINRSLCFVVDEVDGDVWFYCLIDTKYHNILLQVHSDTFCLGQGVLISTFWDIISYVNGTCSYAILYILL